MVRRQHRNTERLFFLYTHWDIFFREMSLENATEITTDCIKFCVDTDPKMENKSLPQQQTLYHKVGEGVY